MCRNRKGIPTGLALFTSEKKKSGCQAVGGGGVGYRDFRREEGTGKPQVFLGSLLGTCR